LVCESIGHRDKKVHINTCPILNGYQYRAVMKLQIQKHCECNKEREITYR